MSVPLYMDVNVPIAVTRGLRLRGVDVLRAHEDGTTRLPDPDLLDRATVLNRLLFTQDQDLLVEAAARQRDGRHFGGIAFADQLRVTIGRMVLDLELIAKVYDPADVANTVTYLPL